VRPSYEGFSASDRYQKYYCGSITKINVRRTRTLIRDGFVAAANTRMSRHKLRLASGDINTTTITNTTGASGFPYLKTNSMSAIQFPMKGIMDLSMKGLIGQPTPSSDY
jgi:hypothetical protein